ncbi:MAG: LysR family transcriptional regulator [Rhodocyclaceae bacterium]
MNLNQLQTFVHVAEHGSFSKAALVLGVAQPALSRQVRALEIELHETLLLRHGRGVRLTDAGQRLLEHCQDILHMVTRAKEDLLAQRNEPVGQVTVAMPPTLARLHTLALIRAFQAEMPRARLAVVEGFSVHLTEWLLTGRSDMALMYSPEAIPALDILPLRQERLCLISPVGQSPGKPVTLQQLARYPLVMPQRGQTFRNLMESAAAMAGVQLNVVWEVSSVPVILDLVAAGMGHAALGEEAIRSYDHPERLAVAPFADAGILNTLCLVTPAQKRTTPLILRTAGLLRRIIEAS